MIYNLSHFYHVKVNVYERKLSSGKISFYLHYSVAGIQRRDKLSTPVVKAGSAEYKHYLRVAKRVAAKKEEELIAGEYGLAVKPSKVRVLDFMREYSRGYTKTDRRKVEALVGHLESFYGDNPAIYSIDQSSASEFKDYLRSHLASETTRNYLAVVKKAIDLAIDKGLLKHNVFRRVTVKGDSDSIKKDVLTLEEIRQLMQTPCSNPEVKRAFLFSCMTGITLAEIKILKWSQIQNNTLKYSRLKTGNTQKVQVPINTTGQSIIGKKKTASQFVFNHLPTSNGVNKILKTWMRNSGIDKHITFYCARHTFGTLQAEMNTNQKTIASNLGHSSTRHTDKYVRAVDEAKRKAVNFDIQL